MSAKANRRGNVPSTHIMPLEPVPLPYHGNNPRNRSTLMQRYIMLAGLQRSLHGAYKELAASAMLYDKAIDTLGATGYTARQALTMRAREDSFYAATEHIYQLMRDALADLSLIPDRPAF